MFIFGCRHEVAGRQGVSIGHGPQIPERLAHGSGNCFGSRADLRHSRQATVAGEESSESTAH